MFSKKFYGINHPTFENIINKDHQKKGELQCSQVENGIILPLRKTELPALDAIYEGGVCDENFKFIAGYKRSNTRNSSNFDVVRSYKPNQKIEFIDEEVIFGGVAFHHFGHFIIESLNRLWWVIKNREKTRNLKVIFLKNRNFDAPFLKLLTYLGLKNDQIIFLDKPTQFRKVYVPDQSLYFFTSFYKEYAIPYDEIVDNIPLIQNTKHSKIYLSRTQFKKDNDVINEEYFENFYRQMGYSIIYPEKLTIEEQVLLVSNADEIVSTIGTLSHLAVFAKKNARIVSLLRTRDYCVPAQIIINQAKKLDYVYIDVTCNILPTRFAPHCCYIAPTICWKEFVKEHYNIKIEQDLVSYFNSEESYLGDYFSSWIRTFSQDKWMRSIYNDTSINILDNLEIIFQEQPSSFITKASQFKHPVSSQEGDIKLTNSLKGKILKFSHYNGDYMRVISLNNDGRIQTVNGKNHINEAFWRVNEGRLYFFDEQNKATSEWFYLEEKEDGLEGTAYYKSNPSILFKLKEINL